MSLKDGPIDYLLESEERESLLFVASPLYAVSVAHKYCDLRLFFDYSYTSTVGTDYIVYHHSLRVRRPDAGRLAQLNGNIFFP